MRCFVALKPSEVTRLRIAGLQDELREAQADVKWIASEHLHLTLKFLGDLDEAGVARLQASLAAEAARLPRFRLEYSGLGEFPRIVWVGASRAADPLAAAVEAAAEREGVPRERHGFTAHLTIGRIRSPRASKELFGAIEARRGVQLGTDEISEFSLIRSTLTPEGPVYESLSAFRLAAS
jgi:2'-5' RNA ligase